MILNRTNLLLVFVLSLNSLTSFAQPEVDILDYDIWLEPNIQEQSITGKATIDFKTAPGMKEIQLQCGNLTIERVTGYYIGEFEVEDGQLTIAITQETPNLLYRVTIDYHGKPQGGLFFNTDLNEAYTVYATSNWMPCNNIPRDKATIDMSLLLPNNLKCVASGTLHEKIAEENKTLHVWKQHYESPPYTYGFAVGDFNEFTEKEDDVTLHYFAQHHTVDKLKSIFKETPKMIRFFENKTGLNYPQSTYSQVLIGNHYQEGSGFAVLKNTYGNLALKDSTETNLFSHELAHQWWGNRVTCRSWRHFWLNEAMATFMSAAYNEHRFGKEKYNADIDSYQRVYEDIKKRGKDKALVFPNWNNPTHDDRNIVYFKGAYVLHLLRQEMSDDAFWKGIKFYTQTNFDEYVVTADFQEAMQRFSETDLTSFFNRWVYAR